jgi:hypothetical protein
VSRAVLVAAVVFGVFVSGCEEREVRRSRGLLEGLPGVIRGDGREAADQKPGDQEQGFGAERPLVIENADGSVTLRTYQMRDVMVLIARLLSEEKDDLLHEQLVSDAIKLDLELRGRSPRDAVTLLRENREDILKMFGRMPAAEQTPGVIADKQARNMYELRLTGTLAQDMAFTKMWVVFEKGMWKFYWAN